MSSQARAKYQQLANSLLKPRPALEITYHIGYLLETVCMELVMPLRMFCAALFAAVLAYAGPQSAAVETVQAAKP